jgi:hypothetical protein
METGMKLRLVLNINSLQHDLTSDGQAGRDLFLDDSYKSSPLGGFSGRHVRGLSSKDMLHPSAVKLVNTFLGRTETLLFPSVTDLSF